jgi:class 3 adenylate cyclase
VAQLPTGTVTFLFTDVEGSTRLFEEHAGDMQAVMARHDELVRGVVARHSGHVVKFTGDGVHTVFATATDAIDAAASVQIEIARCQWPGGVEPRVGAGVHTGEAALRAGDYFGSEVNRAARIMSVAHGGQIVCSASTTELVRDQIELLDLGDHRLRDLHSKLRLFQVTGPGLRLEFPPLRSLEAYPSNLPVELSSFVGRESDVDAVAALLAESRAVTVIGVGGVGKTRLALRVGSEVLPGFPDGVWLCELASVRAGEDLTDAVADALGYVPPQGTNVTEGLPRFLAHKSMLVILDNCEHLVRSAAAFVAETLLASIHRLALATGVSGSCEVIGAGAVAFLSRWCEPCSWSW